MSRSKEAKSSQIKYVDGPQVSIRRPASSVFLRVTIHEDRSVRRSVIKRAFPLTHSYRYLSIQDSEGHEVCVLNSTEGMDADSLREIEAEFDRRYYTPRIDRICDLIADAGMWRFDVDTQRGSRRFFVRNWRDSAYEISAGRWHITSVDGARYEIVDLTKLDEASQRFMDLLL